MVVFLLPFVVLWPARAAGPVADDFYFIGTAGEQSIARAFVSGWGHPMGRSAGLRPMVLASYAIDHRLHGHDAAGWRLTNFALHGANGVLLALLVVRLTRSRLPGLVAGALFAVHPAHHENIMWISGRPYLLATSFSLAAILIVMIPAVGDTGTRRRGASTLPALSASVLAVAALSSYEGVVVIAPLAVLLALASPAIALRHALRATMPLWLATGAYLAWRFVIVSAPADDVAYLVRADSLSSAIGNLENLGLRLFACGGCVRFREPLSSGVYVASMGVALLACGIVSVRHPRTVVVLTLSAIVAFAPFITADAFTDRFTYLATVPLAVLVAHAIAVLAADWRRALVGAALLCLLSAAWSRQLVLLGRDWVVAGVLARTVLERLKAHVPTLSQHTALYVFDLPGLVGEAPVFPTYFFLAVQLTYGNPRLAIHERGRSTDAAAVADALAVRRPADYVLRWRPEGQRWETIAGPGAATATNTGSNSPGR